MFTLKHNSGVVVNDHSVIHELAVMPASQNCPIDKRDAVLRSGRIQACWATRGNCGSCRFTQWVDLRLVPFESHTKIGDKSCLMLLQALVGTR